MGGCAAEEDVSGMTATVDMPSVYADAKVESLVDGANAEQAEYQGMLQACQQAGASTVPLSGEDAALLGTGRLQWWVTSDRVALRREYWDLANTGDVDQCHFALAHSGVHEYFDADRSVAFELPGRDVMSEGPGDLASLRRIPGEPIDPGEAEAALASGTERGARTEVQGQPCQEWTTSAGTTCKWTGGGDWGFTASPGFFQMTDSLSENEVILRQEPASGNGPRIILNRFMLGEPWTRDALLPEAAEEQEDRT